MNSTTFPMCDCPFRPTEINQCLVRTCAGQATQPDRPTAGLTRPSEVAPEAPTLGRARTMAGLPVGLCLLLPLLSSSLARLAIDTNRFRREKGTYTEASVLTVSAVSGITCAVKCTRIEEWFCGGYTYFTGGCDLYKESWDGLAVTPQDDNYSGPFSYRLRHNSTFSGELHCF